MATSTLNFNIGVLGHIDSGKTSLAKALSTVGSTACYDKSPQSKDRGITIDLGFSSFIIDMPDHMDSFNFEKLQITLVDCPGHASLIRTIIGGAQIIDLMMLVIDITKGMQTQTAECLVIGEITCEQMIVIINKIDLIAPEKRESAIAKISKRMKLTLQSTKFKDAPIVAVSAKPGGPESKETGTIGLEDVISALQKNAYFPRRDSEGPFVYAVDHCFSIRGQGTIMTGTVLQGTVSAGDVIEIASLKETRKVKSMQMFRQPVNTAKQGDRVGICVTQFDPKLLERGLVCFPGYVKQICAAIVDIHKIAYFKGAIQSKSKFHISAGHETGMARITIFGLLQDPSISVDSKSNQPVTDHCFDFSKEYIYQDQFYTPNETNTSDKENHNENIDIPNPLKQYALLEFDKPMPLIHNCLLIGSKLDTDIHTNSCRLAFRSSLLFTMEDRDYLTTALPALKVYKDKHKEGLVDRIVNEKEVIGKTMFKRKTNISLFEGLKVRLSTGEMGVIEGFFGQTGKVKIIIPEGLLETTLNQGKTKKKSRHPVPEETEVPVKREPIKILLQFKRYMYDPEKKIIQSKIVLKTT